MKSIKTIITIIIVLGLLVIVKIMFFTSKVAKNSITQVKAPAINVTAHIVKPEKLDNKIFAVGTVLANEEVDLKPEASGKIVQLLFKEGSAVSRGDLLLKLNDADLVAQLKKLQLQVKLAEDKEARQKKLLGVQGISQEDYDAVLNTLESLKADMEYTNAQIAKTELRAPFNGIIGLKSVSEGSYVSPTVKIASIQQVDPVKIDFSVPEKYAELVNKGDKVFFKIQGRDEQFKGEVYAIEPKIELVTRTLQLRAICSNKEGKIVPGSFAKVDMVLKQTDNTILVPTEAIVPELKGQKVFVCKNGKAQSQKVQTGLRTDTSIEITSGLQAGDTVITTGIMQLKQGVQVKITEIK